MEKRKKGLPGAGPRPFGYEKWDPKNPNSQPLREEEADLIRRGTEMILLGAPRYQVTKVFNESGVKTANGKSWSAAKVGKLLTRWRNAGLVEYLDEPVGPAIWPAIVTEDDLRNVRTLFGRGRAPGRWKAPTKLCSGIARCVCGYQLTCTGSKVGPSYRCGMIIAQGSYTSEPHVTIAAKILDPIVRDAVVDAYFSRPASSDAGRAEASSLARVYDKQQVLREDRAKVQQLARAGVYKPDEAGAEIAKIEAAIAELSREAQDLIASSAHAAMLAESMNAWVTDLDLTANPASGEGTFHAGLALAQSALRSGANPEHALNAAANARWWTSDESGEPVRVVDPAVREAVAQRFDSLELEQRRDLTRSLVTITVLPVQGGRKRVVVEPIGRASVPV